jgi:hypothetical protein
VVVGNPRHERAEVAREADRHGGDGSGLDDEKQRPAVEESPEWRERFTQIDVLAAGAWHHRGEFAVRERADDGQDAGQHPGAQQPARTADVPRHVGRDDEDARPDHRPDDDHRRVVQSEPAVELGIKRGCRCRRAAAVGHRSLPD